MTAEDDPKRLFAAFTEIPHFLDKTHHVAQGFHVQTLLRWGDAVLPDAPPFDPHAQHPEAQSRQFGFNNDFIAFMPLLAGSKQSDHGLLCVNHEYTHARHMFPKRSRHKTAVEMQIEQAAHGHSIVEIKQQANGQWHVVQGPYNRRFTAGSTRFQLSGPAAGHSRLKTALDPTGTSVIGTLNNCAGGVTPWGTVLICEENIDDYFGGTPSGTEADNHTRMGVGSNRYGWAELEERFDVSKQPHEPNRFGWVVETDPYDPTSQPVKRTALGRFKHEGATCALAPDGRVVIYSGDDEVFQHIYRFVSRDSYRPDDPTHNRTLLDHGTLYAARLDEDGNLTWLPVLYGHGPLTEQNGFHSQADLLIDTRHAAALMGATPMDRPEDIETNPVTGKVYAVMTNNLKRLNTNPANPRPINRHGHIIEFTPPDLDGQPNHAADQFQWDIFLLAGDPSSLLDGAQYPVTPSEHGWLSCPDNIAFAPDGTMWIATDGQQKSRNVADSLFACATEGASRGQPRHFFSAPRGAEICGPCFTPDGSTLFASIQHPGDEKGYSAATPSTRWPDFDHNLPPRPSVVAVTLKL